MMLEKWSEAEERQIYKFFNNNWTQKTVYEKINKINPNRTYDAISRKIRRLKEEGLEKARDKAHSKLRIGYLDIEASQLNGSFGIILSWMIKPKGKNKFYNSVITKKELFDYDFDKRVIKELLEALKNFDIIYTHYGSDYRFDIPFIRTRVYANGLHDLIPDKMELFIRDTYPILKSKLKLHSNRLDAAGEILGVTIKKTPLSAKIWQLASYGDKKALNYIKEHNKRDVQILEKVHEKLEKIENKQFSSI